MGAWRASAQRVGPEGWGTDLEKVGEPRGWGPKGLGPEGWGPRRVGPAVWGARRVGARRRGAQNFALVFPSPAPIFALFPSLSGGLFVSFFLSPGGFLLSFSLSGGFLLSFSLSGGFLLSFFSLSGDLLVEFWWCFGRPGPSKCARFRFGTPAVSVPSPRSEWGCLRICLCRNGGFCTTIQQELARKRGPWSWRT